MLKDKIKADLFQSRKKGDEKRVKCIKIILGEIERLPYKDVSDHIIRELLSHLLKVTSKYNELKYNDELAVILVEYLDGHIITEKVISDFIDENIDFTKEFSGKNKLKAIGVIKKNFKNTDGNLIKKIVLQKYEERM
jgi:uncharacterized protein YqeY